MAIVPILQHLHLSKATRSRLNMQLQKEDVLNFNTRILVAGTRHYSDFDEFCRVLCHLVMPLDLFDSVFISGAAKTGADRLIIDWCKLNRYDWVEYPADWNKFDKSAGFVRNREMSQIPPTHSIFFWDNVSGGTKNMIDLVSHKSHTAIFSINNHENKEILQRLHLHKW